MPTYTYSCPECQLVEEVFHKMSETPEVLCKACKDVRCSKVVVYAPMFSLGPELVSTTKQNYYGKKSDVPINIIDKDEDGNITKVTTVSKDGREPEPLKPGTNETL